jgi:queuine tRNA-ribosyltransferase/7-cyano-7-deazaguanine tRNA-ribosyltransferase
LIFSVFFGLTMFSFEILAKDGDARTGRVMTPHGIIETPSFVAVGTLGSVTAMSVQDLKEIGTQVMISNTYHLHLQPGEELIGQLGGLHQFMGWDKPLMTDSGGFQIFSLGAGKEHEVGKIASIFPEGEDRGGHHHSKKGRPLVNIDETGATFTSYLDGSHRRFTPEGVIGIQRRLGADIILVLDECTSPLHDYAYTKTAMDRTHRWSERALKAFRENRNDLQALFGIVQGGAYRDLREESTAFVSDQDFDGYAIGGSLGKSKEDMHRVLEWSMPHLQDNRPRHLLGIGTVEDIFEIVKRGIDLFDCVAPTRLARTGTLFKKEEERFRIHIRNEKYKHDPLPVDALGARLAVIHNLHFLETLMVQIRKAIKDGRFREMTREWIK